jgi:hypothetical protein
VSPLDDGDGDDTNTSEAAVATLIASSAYVIGTPNQATVTIDEEPTVTLAATTATTAEDSGAAGVFTFTRTGGTDLPLTVSYTLGGTAIDGTDYQDPGTSVTIPVGQSSTTVSIAPLDDGDGDDHQTSESVVAALATGSDYYVGTPNQATVTIDEEPPPIVTIVASTSPISETGSTPGIFTVTRTGPTDDSLTVSYSVSGSASEGTDYDTLSGNVTIPVGQSSELIDVTPIDDGDGDDTTPSNTVTATLSSSSAYTIGNLNSATVTIDEDFKPIVTISALPSSIAEVGGSGNFVVSLNAAAFSDIVVDYSVSGSAASGTDYQPLSGSVLVPAGHTSADIAVTPVDDGDGDDNGQSASVTAALQTSSAYVVGSPSSATMTITEDAPPPSVTIYAATATTSEGSGSPGVFTVYASSAPSSNLTVYYNLGGNAQNGTDYSSLGGSVVIPAGQYSANINVSPLDDGDTDDNGQSAGVTATLGSGTGYTVGSPNSATVTINEESPPSTVTLNVEMGWTMEGNNSSPGGVMLSVYPAPTTTITVNYSLSGSAINGTDYQWLGGTVTIPAGTSSAGISIAPLDDGDGDDNQTSEYVTVTLTSGTGYVVGPPNSGTVTINEEYSGPPQMLSLPPVEDPSATSVNAAQVRDMVDAGAMRWLEAGIPLTTIVADLRGLRIDVQDLPGSMLGEADSGTRNGERPEIVIDKNAAGYGWFVDPTPLDDNEFVDIVAPSQRQAVGNSPAAGHVDLLTVVMHEMGHLFGLPDLPNAEYPYDLMAETLDLSTRRLPLSGPPDVPSSSTQTAPGSTAADEVFRLFGEKSFLPEARQFAQVGRIRRDSANGETEIAV